MKVLCAGQYCMELSVALTMVVAVPHGSLPAGSPHESTSPWMQGQKSDWTVHQASAWQQQPLQLTLLQPAPLT